MLLNCEFYGPSSTISYMVCWDDLHGTNTEDTFKLLISWRIMPVDDQHSPFPSPCAGSKVHWRPKYTVWQVCSHLQTDHCSSLASSVYASHTRISVGCLQDTLVFSEIDHFFCDFTVIHLSRVAFLLKRKLFLSLKNFMFPLSLWNTKPKET